MDTAHHVGESMVFQYLVERALIEIYDYDLTCKAEAYITSSFTLYLEELLVEQGKRECLVCDYVELRERFVSAWLYAKQQQHLWDKALFEIIHHDITLTREARFEYNPIPNARTWK
jgi:hypothetical protein